jgi:hypothetical protein
MAVRGGAQGPTLPMREPLLRPPFRDLSRLSRRRLLAMRKAADALFEVLEEIRAAGGHPVKDLLASNDEPFTRFVRYPADSAGEAEDLCSWYYHAHDPSETRPWEEHGHFHCFLYTEHMPARVKPLALPADADLAAGGLIHLVGLSVARDGTPIRMFTLNRWASNEWLYPAAAIAPLVDRFVIARDRRFALTSRWLSAILRLLQPQIAYLLAEREKLLLRLRKIDPQGFSEDRSIDISSTVAFDLDVHIAALDAALGKCPNRARLRA